MTDTFHHVCNIERPIMLIRHLLGALNLIVDTLDECEGSAVYAVVSAALDHVAQIDAEYATLFRLTHPDRERFEREGWPTVQDIGTDLHNSD